MVYRPLSPSCGHVGTLLSCPDRSLSQSGGHVLLSLPGSRLRPDTGAPRNVDHRQTAPGEREEGPSEETQHGCHFTMYVQLFLSFYQTIYPNDLNFLIPLQTL